MSFGKLHADDYDFVDVEGEAAAADVAGTSEMKPRGGGRAKKKVGATLEEDLQFSSEEEFDEVPLSDGEGDDNKMSIIVSAEVPSDAINVGADDDSQQAAEAMMQLGNIGFYQQTEQNEPVMFKGTIYSFQINTSFNYIIVRRGEHGRGSELRSI